LAAVDAGLSRRGAAARFGVSAASVIRWDQLRRLQGHARPKPQGGDKTSHRIEAHAEVILEAVRVQPDITLKELGSYGDTVGNRPSPKASGLVAFGLAPRLPAARSRPI
jgi:transposase